MKSSIRRGRQLNLLQHRPLFQVTTPLKIIVRTTAAYWKVITEIKHPQIKNKKVAVQRTLKNPELIRQSKRDENVFLHYRKENERYICVITRALNGDGFIITAYTTKKIAEGKTIWQKNKISKK